MRIHETMIGLLFFAVLSITVVRPVHADDPLESPRSLLRKAGLREEQRHWICRAESRLLRQLESVAALEDEIRRTRRKWRTLGDDQHRLREQIDESNKTIERLDDEIAAATAAGLRRQRLEDRQGKLRQQLTKNRNRLFQDLDGLNERTEFTRVARRLVVAYVEAEALRISLRNSADRPATWYQALDDQTRQAIIRLQAENGARTQLGPVKDYAQEISSHGDRLRAALGRNQMPIYREGGRFHIVAVLNDVAPATFGIDDEISISVLPSSLLAVAGISIPADAPRREIAIGNHRAKGRTVKIAAFRIGPLVLQDIEFLAVATDSEGDGPLIASSALDDQPINWNYERLVLSITGKPKN